jgi:hypothetical protein
MSAQDMEPNSQDRRPPRRLHSGGGLSRRSPRWRLPRPVAIALILVLLCMGVLPLALPDTDLTPRAKAGTRVDHAEITIAGHARPITVPDSFLGLSTEYWTLPLWAPQMRLLERAIVLFHAPGNGPMVLRIGGDSADHSFWEPSNRRLPGWMFAVTPSWMRELSALVTGTGSKLILDLNLVTGSASSAAAWAHAAERGLPRHSITAFEIGNEPDIYSRWYWTHSVQSPRINADLLPRSITLRRYIADFLAYRHALKRVAAGTPLIGPAIAHPVQHANWISDLISADRRSLAAVSAHRYPYSACLRHRAASYPTIRRLLSERATTVLAEDMLPAVRLADRAHLPLRLTELNSVTCGGRRGVSNTFATALWAPDALFELIHAGVAGVNMHVREAINAPFALNAAGLSPRPLLYGLVAFTRMLGPRAQLMPLAIHANRASRLKAWAVRVLGHVLHVLLIDKSAAPATVDLKLPATGSATVERLLAPSPKSTSGVSLAGQYLGRDGRWSGSRKIETVAMRHHRYALRIPPFSAAIVTVRTSPAPPAGRAL